MTVSATAVMGGIFLKPQCFWSREMAELWWRWWWCCVWWYRVSGGVIALMTGQNNSCSLHSAVVFNTSCHMMECVTLGIPHNPSVHSPRSPDTNLCAPHWNPGPVFESWRDFFFCLYYCPVTCWRSRPPCATEYRGWGANSDASNTYKNTREKETSKKLKYVLALITQIFHVLQVLPLFLNWQWWLVGVCAHQLKPLLVNMMQK